MLTIYLQCSFPQTGKMNLLPMLLKDCCEGYWDYACTGLEFLLRRMLNKYWACVHICCCFSRVQLCATPWTVAHQAPLSMIFSRQEYWSGLPFPSPGDLPNPGIEPVYPALAGGFFTIESPGKPKQYFNKTQICLRFSITFPSPWCKYSVPWPLTFIFG